MQASLRKCDGRGTQLHIEVEVVGKQHAEQVAAAAAPAIALHENSGQPHRPDWKSAGRRVRLAGRWRSQTSSA